MKRLIAILALVMVAPLYAGTIEFAVGGTGSIGFVSGGTGSVVFSTTPIAGCGSAPIFVSSNSSAFGVTASTNIIVKNVQAGDLIVVGLTGSMSASSFAVSDNATPTSTYTARTSVTNSAGPTLAQVFIATSNATGNVQINITLTSADSSAHVAVFRNVNAFDVQASGTETGSGTTFNTGTFTTALNNNAIFALYANESTTVTNIAHTSTAGTPIKLGDQLTSVSSSAYFITTAIQAAKTGTVTWTTATTDGVLIYDVFKGTCGL